MTKFKLNALVTGLMSAGLLFAATAQAGTVIYNTGNAATATVALGVNNNGSLNTTPDITTNASATGLAYKFADGTWRDGTAPGCYCEGWGVSVNNAVSGYANMSSGSGGLTVGALSNVTGSSVTTTTSLTAMSGITVSQAYQAAPNAPGALFMNRVTISNGTASDVTNVKYVRVMDWDVPPTEFNEYVTIKGSTTTTLLEESGANGFNTSNPLAGYSVGSYACHNVDCTDVGARDHGAYFRFNFGTLAAGSSYSFDIFYGATGNESDALAAIGSEGIELYSLGQSNGGQTTGGPVTYIFGFKGVGGVAVEPDPTGVPEPESLALLGLGLAALAAMRRRKTA